MFSWTGKKVAITGATGFVGSHAALEMQRQHADVCALVRGSSDVTRLVAANIRCVVAPLENVEELARGVAGSEIVVHAAGAVGFDLPWETQQRVNVAGTLNLLQAARMASVRRVVHVSSIAAVGASLTPESLDETAAWNLKSYRVPYVTTKRLAEEAALAANNASLEVVVVNPASVIGPDDFTASEFGTLCNRFWRGRIRVHFGGGNNFVDVRDVAAGIRLAAERGRSGARYLLAGANRTYSAFFADLCKTAGRWYPRIQLPVALAPVMAFIDKRRTRRRSRPYLAYDQAALMGLYFYFDASRACTELGFHARTLAESLADTHAFWLPGNAAKAA